MEIEGIDRLVIGVKDMDRALALFHDVFGVRFVEFERDGSKVEKTSGCRVAMSLDKHIELISPVAEPQRVTNPPDPLELKRRLETADAVLFAVILKTGDLNVAIVDAERHGVHVVGDRITRRERDIFGKYNFDEVSLAEADTLGIKVALVQYDRDRGPGST